MSSRKIYAKLIQIINSLVLDFVIAAAYLTLREVWCCVYSCEGFVKLTTKIVATCESHDLITVAETDMWLSKQ